MKVEAWKDKSGKLHDNERDQILADAIIDLDHAMQNDSSWYFNQLNIENVDGLMEFIEKNKDLIQKIIQGDS